MWFDLTKLLFSFPVVLKFYAHRVWTWKTWSSANTEHVSFILIPPIQHLRKTSILGACIFNAYRNIFEIRHWLEKYLKESC